MVTPRPGADLKAKLTQRELPLAKLLKRLDITDDLIVIKLKPQVEFDFKPGQYCTLGLEGIERAYSIVSAPHEPTLEIFVELVPLPDGVLTPRIWKLQLGDSMTIRPRAKGIFTLDQRYHHHLMVATVTGIAPYVSFLRSYFHTGGQGHRFYVLQGASYQDEFTYKEELEAMARDHSDVVTYVATVSRPQEERNSGWNGQEGRVNLIVEDYIERWALDPQTALPYACGHPGMIEDMKEHLTPKGFKVKEERFWKQ